MPVGKLCRLAIQLQPFGKSMSLSKLAMTLLALFAIFTANASVFGQQLENAGLKQQWYSHSGIGANEKLADWYLDVDENSGTTYFDIVGGDYLETMSENDLGPNGKPLGVDFGLEMANIEAEIVAARLKSDTGKDVEVTVKPFTLPNSTLYTQTDNGIVRSFDAETGKVRWTTNLGSSPTKSLGVAGRGDYVAALKGGFVFCLDAKTGSVLWSKKCETGPSAPPEVAGEEIYVPLRNGRVERFKIADKGFNSDSFISGGSGSTTTRPAISPVTLCWANYSGTVSVAKRTSDRGMPGFQLTAGGSVLAPPQYKNGIYFVTSVDSYVYALSEARGSLIWENSTGFEISQAPILLGEHVYVINNLNQMSRFEAATGRLSANWQDARPGIGKFAGASRTKIFTVTDAGNLKVLDQESGDVTGTAAVGAVESVLQNTKTDRIYLLNKAGTIRCYREIRSVRPFFHSDELQEMKPEEKMEDKTESPEPDGGNPFGNDADGGGSPFGNDADAGDGDSPFGNDADAGDGDSPFGDGGGNDGPIGDGGASPFGDDGGGNSPADNKQPDEDSEPDNPFGDGDDEPF